MCVIIYQPKDSYLKRDRAKRLWAANPDGGGFAFFDDQGDLQVSKSMVFNQFWKDFEQARSQFPKRQFLAHMRIATHGKVALDNVHPFPLNERQALAHNGIFHKLPDDPLNEISDTRMFIEQILPSFKMRWLDDSDTFAMVEDYLGWSRMAIINNNPRLAYQTYLFNEAAGTHKDGMWFSSHQGINKPPPQSQSILVRRRGHDILLPARVENWAWDDDDDAKAHGFPSEKETKTLRQLRVERYESSRMYYSRMTGEWICTRCKGNILVSFGICDCEVTIHLEHCFKLLTECKHMAPAREVTAPIEELTDVEWDRVAARLPD